MSRSGERRRRYWGVDATSSLVPMHAATELGSISTPKRRLIHVAAASQCATVPIDAG